MINPVSGHGARAAAGAPYGASAPIFAKEDFSRTFLFTSKGFVLIGKKGVSVSRKRACKKDQRGVPQPDKKRYGTCSLQLNGLHIFWKYSSFRSQSFLKITDRFHYTQSTEFQIRLNILTAYQMIAAARTE
jgi:hypothetical protein